MRVLSMTHGAQVRAELFGDVILEDGHEFEEWSLVDAAEPPRPIEEYDSVFVFGGAMNVDEEHEHPWLADEESVLRDLVARRVPLFAVCLGAQQLAKSAGARVARLDKPEDGFVRVDLAVAARADPIFSRLPQQFDALNLHRYAFDVPEGAVELVRSEACTQALRVGECAWGVQFHPEVRLGQVEAWLASEVGQRDADEVERLRKELAEGIGAWSDLGASLCRAFLETAERLAPAAYSPR
jgi:GMP synthase-like glutamine amidotransferase